VALHKASLAQMKKKGACVTRAPWL
jgi:hypothetical protein